MRAAALAAGWILSLTVIFLGIVWLLAAIHDDVPIWATGTIALVLTFSMVTVMFSSLSWLTDHEWRFWR